MSRVYKYNSYKEAMEAVEYQGSNLAYVRPDLQTPEMVEMVVEWSGGNFQYIRKDLQTPKMALEGVKGWGRNIIHVRPDLITPELALIAVKWNGWSLKYVPAHCQTQEVIEAALEDDPEAKEFIKMKEIFKNALEEALSE